MTRTSADTVRANIDSRTMVQPLLSGLAELSACSGFPLLDGAGTGLQSEIEFQLETVTEQGSGPLMEDVTLLQDNLFGVFDGATSLDGGRFVDNLTGGRLAAELAAQGFADNDASLEELFRRANSAVARCQEQQGICLTERCRLWSTSVAVVRLEDDAFSWCQIGDAMIIAVHEDGSHQLLTPESDHDQESLLLLQQTPNPQNLPVIELIGEQVRLVRLGMNRAYGVLNGEPEAAGFLRSGSCSLDGIAALLLFTDGLYLPRQDPASPADWSRMVDLYLQGGLVNVHQHVRGLQKLDPHCRLYPRFKQHDDIAAIALRMPRTGGAVC